MSPSSELRFSLSDLDPAVHPGEDFYSYANGGWCRAHPIPADYSRWGTFLALDRRNREQLRDLLEGARNTPDAPVGSPTQLVGDWYAAAMDEQTIEQAGWDPLRTFLDAIGSTSDPSNLWTLVAHLQKSGTNPFFELGVQQDAKDSTRMIAVVYQGGLGLPERDYYLDPDPFFDRAREAYVCYLATLLDLWQGADPVHREQARAVFAFERELALVSMTPAEQRDPWAIYHPRSVEALAGEIPEVGWYDLFRAHDLPQEFPVNLAQPAFFARLGQLVAETDPLCINRYLALQLLAGFAPALSSAWVDAHFHFAKALTGTEQIQPRWLRVGRALDAGIGFALGKLYVARYFPPASRERTEAIFEQVRRTFRDRISRLGWMSEGTRVRALEKLDRMGTRIGYPDRFRDYPGLVIDRRSYVLNLCRAQAHALAYDLSKIGRPVDPEEWFMTPQTVNAYYHPAKNEMVFPAGILQPPFFDPDMPEAYNYGAIGAVIGHEMTHGFDDQGRKYDAWGNVFDWWTPGDEKGFEERIKDLRIQLQKARFKDGLTLNPELLMGEFIADIGGVNLAFEAMLRAGIAPDAPSAFADLTHRQLFFLAFAHLWAGNVRDDTLRLMLASDPHPPATVRVNETLRNVRAFAGAFPILPEAPLYPAHPIDPWGGM